MKNKNNLDSKRRRRPAWLNLMSMKTYKAPATAIA